MTSIEDRLRDLGRTVAPPPLPGATAVMRRGRQRRRNRRGLGLAAVVAVGTSGTLAVRTLTSDDDVKVLTSSPAAPSDDGSGLPAPTTTTSTSTTSTTTPTTTITTPTTAPVGSADSVLVPDVVGLDVEQARRIVEEIGFRVEVLGDDSSAGSVVVAQAPAAGARFALGGAVRLQPG